MDEDTYGDRNDERQGKGKERAEEGLEDELSCDVCSVDGDICDGERPCAACVRKGIDKRQCINGCRACQLTQLACDGKSPCSNCERMGQDCIISDGALRSTSSIATVQDLVPSPPQLPYERTKVACMACRRDNKRCENTRPCARCIRRREDCIKMERSRKKVKKRCQACRANKEKCDDQRPCSRCIEKGLNCEDEARKTGGPGSRSRRACTYCRRSKLQCDNVKPCKNCVRRDQECVTVESDVKRRKSIPVLEARGRDSPGPSTRAEIESSTTQRISFARNDHPSTSRIEGPARTVNSSPNSPHSPPPSSTTLRNTMESVNPYISVGNTELQNRRSIATGQRLPPIRSILSGSWTTLEDHHSVSHESTPASSPSSYGDQESP